MYTELEVKKLLNPVFDVHKVKKAILFGSVAKNRANEHSDVDILVDSGLKGIAFFGLLEDVVQTLGKKVDLIDTSQIVDGSRLDNEIKNSGVVIYG